MENVSEVESVEFLDLQSCTDEERVYLAQLLGKKPPPMPAVTSMAPNMASSYPKPHQHPHRPPFPPPVALAQSPVNPRQLLNGHAHWNHAPIFPAMATPRIPAPFAPYTMPPAFITRMPNINPNPYMPAMQMTPPAQQQPPQQLPQHMLVPQPVQQQHQQLGGGMVGQTPVPQQQPQLPHQLPLHQEQLHPLGPQQVPLQQEIQAPLSHQQQHVQEDAQPHQVQQHNELIQQEREPERVRVEGVVNGGQVITSNTKNSLSNLDESMSSEASDLKATSPAEVSIAAAETEAVKGTPKDESELVGADNKGEITEEQKRSNPPIDEREVSSLNVEPKLPPKPRSWASLFSSSEATATTTKPLTSDRNNNSVNMVYQQQQQGPGIKEETSTKPLRTVMAEQSVEGMTLLNTFLRNYALLHKPLSLRPHGLSNRSNWCFVNSVLQALLACPSFYNLVRAMPMPEEKLTKLRAIKQFIGHFDTMANFPKLNRYRGKKAEDLPIGNTIEPTEILDVLLNIKPSDSFKVQEGRQEDAEEFLSFLLNAMHDEMVSVLSDDNTEDNDEGFEIGDRNGGGGGHDDDWKEVGPKNRSCVTRRQTRILTPLSSIFQGQIRSSVQQSSSGELTANLQPFFTLQLDLQNDAIKTVSDALLINLSTEKLDDYVCPSTKQVVAATQNLALEELPPVLILLLKRFVYDNSSGSGQVQKLMKPIAFTVDLEVPKEVLSASGRARFNSRQRLYKLFAVVSHNGTEANKGHYVTDVYHAAMATWLRFDDSVVKATTESSVLSPPNNSCPYLLFYRRGDTTIQHEKLAKN